MSAHSPSLKNFRNPVGLLFRMLLSGRKAAYSALLLECLRIAARPLDSMLRPRERRLFEQSVASTGQPLILVVGAPRSGTTLVYQTLVQYLDVSYFSNLTSLFPSSPVTGTRLFGGRRLSGAADFGNFYGQTSGLRGPNDGFCVWNRWLGHDRYAPASELPYDRQQQMRQFFDVWCQEFQKPFLNKNNRNTSCMALLAETLPNACFVVVRRDPMLVCQSLIHAREQVQGSRKCGWGLHSKETVDAGDPLSYVDDVCLQLTQIDSMLDQQIKRIAVGRIVEVQYEEFCRDPHRLLTQVIASIPGVSLNPSADSGALKAFKPSSSVTLNRAEQQRVKQWFDRSDDLSQQFRQATSQQRTAAPDLVASDVFGG